MPFCRECGKGVEHDWVTCPYCSQTIGPSNLNTQSVQDSVIMGDVNTNINDSASISAAMKKTLKCPNCHSTGAILIGCKSCDENAGCSICIDEIASSRRFSMKEHSKEIEWYFDYEDKKGDVSLDLYKGKCLSCWKKEKESLIASEIEACSGHKQKIISSRNKARIMGIVASLCANNEGIAQILEVLNEAEHYDIDRSTAEETIENLCQSAILLRVKSGLIFGSEIAKTVFQNFRSFT